MVPANDGEADGVFDQLRESELDQLLATSRRESATFFVVEAYSTVWAVKGS